MAFISIILCAAVLYLMRGEIRSRRAEEQAEQEREVMREERSASRMDRAARREELLRILAVENEQRRQAEEQKRQAGILEKHDADIVKIAKEQAKQAEQIRKLEFKAQQAEKDIDFILHQMEEKRSYGEYLELERDASVYGGKYYHIWNNRVIANNNQLHTLEKQLDKAMNARDEAKIKLREVA